MPGGGFCLLTLSAVGMAGLGLLALGCGSNSTKVEPESATDDPVLKSGTTMQVPAKDIERGLVLQGDAVAIALPFDSLPAGTGVDNWSKYRTDDSHVTAVLFEHVPVGTIVTAPMPGRAQRGILRYPSGGTNVQVLVLNIETDPPAPDGTRLLVRLYASTKSALLADLPDTSTGADQWTRVELGWPLLRITDPESPTPPSAQVPDHNVEMQVSLWEAQSKLVGPMVGFLRDKKSGRWLLPSAPAGEGAATAATPSPGR